MIGGERVFVVAREDLFPGGRAPHGFVAGAQPYLDVVFRRGFFCDRAAAEEDASLKQVIPYAVLHRAPEVFLYRRRSGGGERRLFGLRSIGVGGHLNPEDGAGGAALVQRGLHRELREEVGIGPEPQVGFVGILNNDTTPVGRVHLGLVAVVEAGKSAVTVREPDRMSGAFVGRRELGVLHARERHSFEGWSALLIDRLDEVLPWERPHGSSTTTPSGARTSTT
ncbi:MAG: hypothetical protein ACE5JG_04050 [Planctomycetota bacterium]